MISIDRRFPCSQRGAAALGVTLLLLFILTLLALLGTRITLRDTRAVGNEVQSARAFSAAEAGLDFGAAWLNANTGPHEFVPDALPFGGVPPCAAASVCQRIKVDQSLSVDGYNVTVRFRRKSVPLEQMNYLEVISYAVSATDISNRATSRQSVFLSPFNKNNPGAGAAPLVINGCLSGVTGTSDLYPQGPGQSGIVSSNAAGCLDNGFLDLHGGAKVGNGFTGTAWDYLFPGISKTQMQALAQAQIDAGLALGDRTVHWITSTANWHDSVGSLGPPARPVILAFAAAAGCPKINGNPTIVGIVYYEGGCDSQGFGGATLHGSLVYEGSLTKLTANTSLNYSDAVATVVTTGQNLGGKVPRIAGSWRDF